MSITSVNITSETNAIVNSVSTAITNWTYTLNMAIIDAAGVVITNTTSPNVQVTIKFTNTNSYNKKQILIYDNKITIDGENQTLDLTGVLLYNGLIKISDGFSDIQINNIDIKVNSVSTLNGTRKAWVCEGLMNNTGVTFTNCKVHSDDSITISNNYCGGICGGSNGDQNPTNDTVNLSFTDCILSAINDININGDSVGGICGGDNGVSTLTGIIAIVTLTFTNCNVNSNNININGNSCGGICGGNNCDSTSTGSTTTVNVEFTNCNVVSINDINIYGNSFGGICGGNGSNNFGTSNINVQLTFISCDVSALNINYNNLGCIGSGGICGGFNGYGNASNVTGTVNLIFNTCIVSTTNDINIYGTNCGGICGGYNGFSSNNVNVTINFTNCDLNSSGEIFIDFSENGGICGGNNKMTVTFVNCILYYCTFITFEGADISSVTYFYLLLPGPPLYIIGNTNSNTMNLDQLSGIQSNCLPPPPPPPCNPPPNPPNLWSRATLSCVNYDQEQLNMRRKAEILKYKGNQTQLTKKQQFSRNVNGNGPLGKKVWATQNILGSNPNVFNLPQVGNTLILCPTDNYFAYVTNRNNNNISGYRINQTTGELISIGTFPAGNSPWSITIVPNGKFAYVANNGSSNVTSYTINQTTGELTSIGTVTSSNNPSSVSVDPSGKFAYVANMNGGNVSGYEINQTTGILTPIGTFPAQGFMRSVSVDPSGKFAYVVNTSSIYNSVSGYTINQNTGALTNISPGSPFPAGGEPWSVVSNKKFVYVANQQDNTVSGYTIDQTTGALTNISPGSPFTAGLGPSSVTIDPTGRFLYVTNNGNLIINGNVLGYTINQTTGALIQMTASPFTAGLAPGSVTVEMTGNFAYVANNNSNNVSAYRIHQTTGELTPIGTFLAGGYPTSVTTVRLLSSSIKCEPSSSSDVPGNSILCYDPAVPLVNYLPPPRTYLAGGTKWPQYSWQPGDNGFPRGKKGMGMLFQ